MRGIHQGFYQTLPVIMAELLSEERRRLRFTRFRARARDLQEMARIVAYGAEQEQLRKTQLRGKEKRELKEALYRKKRVVFFGYAQVGHGLRGPCFARNFSGRWRRCVQSSLSMTRTPPGAARVAD